MMSTEGISSKHAFPLAYRYESILKLFDQGIKYLWETRDESGKAMARQLDGACYRFQLWALDISVPSPSKQGSAVDVLGIINDIEDPVIDEAYSLFDEIAKKLFDPLGALHAGQSDSITSGLFIDIEALGSLVQRIRQIYQQEISKHPSVPFPGGLVLCFDGGGVRSYSSLLILKALMDIIDRLRVENSEGAFSAIHDSITRPRDFFDYIVGSSSGGLIAIMLGRLRMTVDECIENFIKYAHEIFSHPRIFSIKGPIFWPRAKYNSQALERAVNAVVKQYEQDKDGSIWRRNSFAAVDDHCKTAVIATASASKDFIEGPYLFRTYDHFGEPGANRNRVLDRMIPHNPGEASPASISTVARATSAAPILFDTVKLDGQEFLDGGFGFNNPSMEALLEVSNMYKQYKRYLKKRKDNTPNYLPKSNDYRRSSGLDISKSELSKGSHTVLDNGSDKKIVLEVPPDLHETQPSPVIDKATESGYSVDMLLSIGTGVQEITRFNKGRGNLQKYAQLLLASTRLTVDSERTHWEILNMKDRTSILQHYYRFNVHKSALSRIRFDEWKIRRDRNETLDIITRETQDYCAQPEVREQLQECAKYLLLHRRTSR